jgi:hypothetical protein
MQSLHREHVTRGSRAIRVYKRCSLAIYLCFGP